MMEEQKSDPELFNYAVNLKKRMRSTHPLRQVKAAIDFIFVHKEVKHCYGKGQRVCRALGDLKMMFLLFFDDIKSERELMEVIGERPDCPWFFSRPSSRHRH